MARRLPLGVEERQLAVVATRTVVLWWLTASSRRSSVPGRGQVGTAPGPCRCAAGGWGSTRSWSRGRRARPGRRRRASARTAAGARPSAGSSPASRCSRSQCAPSRRRCPRWPSASCPRRARAGSRPGRRRARLSSPRSRAASNPCPARSGVTRSRVGPRDAAVAPVDVDERQAGLDAQQHQRLLAERPDAVPLPGVQHGVKHGQGVVGRDRDLVAEVAGVAGAGHGDRRVADLGRGVREVAERLGLRGEGGEHGVATAAPAPRGSP